MKKGIIKKCIVFGIIMLFVGTGTVSCISGSLVNNEKKKGNNPLSSEWRYPPNIIVPDNFLTIQQAYANASQGDCIGVRNGSYNESISIYKNSITLEGDLTAPTIIYGRIYISASSVTISDFNFICNYSSSSTILSDSYITNLKILNNSITSNGYFNHGIYVILSNDITISGNEIGSKPGNASKTMIGIEMVTCFGFYIDYNKIYNCDFGMIFTRCFGPLEQTINVVVQRNKITENNVGIRLFQSRFLFQQNEISNNSKMGIESKFFSFPIIISCNITNNYYSLVFNTSLGIISHCNIINENVDILVKMRFGVIVLATSNYWGKPLVPAFLSPRRKCLPLWAPIILSRWEREPINIHQSWPD